MDINCPKCAEPIDNEEFHYVAEAEGITYNEVVRGFRKIGCPMVNMQCNEETLGSFKSQAASAMFELMGDDADGVSAMMDDFEYMGMI